MDEFESSTFTPNERRDILYRYMLENTNQEHPISKDRILDFLGTRNIKISRNTLFEDFEFIEATYDVDIKYDKGKNGYYIISTPVFEEHELHLILDITSAIKYQDSGYRPYRILAGFPQIRFTIFSCRSNSLKAAPFIMPDKKAALITKLLRFTDKYSRKALLDEINENPYQQVDFSKLDLIFEAIREECKIQFDYPLLSHGGEPYQEVTASPYAVLFDGKHYLLFACRDYLHGTLEDYDSMYGTQQKQYELLDYYEKKGMEREYEDLIVKLSSLKDCTIIEFSPDGAETPCRLSDNNSAINIFALNNIQRLSLLHSENRRNLKESRYFEYAVKLLEDCDESAPISLRWLCSFINHTYNEE